MNTKNTSLFSENNKMGYTVYWDQHSFTNFTYNNVTKLVQKVINVKFELKEWGFLVGNNENECVGIGNILKHITFVKTNRLPYTKDVMKTLIVMAEYGAASNLNHDDSDMSWYLEALEEVHAIQPLASYEMQKAYFMAKHTPPKPLNNIHHKVRGSIDWGLPIHLGSAL